VRIRAEKLPPPDPQLVERQKKLKTMTEAWDEAWPRAQEAWRQGQYSDARDALVALEVDYLDSDRAAQTTFLLGSAYVALGEEAPALVQFRKLRERKPEFTVSADETSPHVWKLLVAVGGQVVE
jgi:TolA-binding protein